MATIEQERFSCAVCGNDFEDDILVRPDMLESQDSDFRIHMRGLQPLAYLVHRCPACGYTAYRPGDPLPEPEKKLVADWLQSVESPLPADEVRCSEKYRVLAELEQARSFPAMDVADAWLKAAWAAEDEGDNVRSRQFRQRSLEVLLPAVDGECISPMELPVAVYLAGELNRRLGRFDDALHWFARVETADAHLARLCRQQQELASEKNAGNARIELSD